MKLMLLINMFVAAVLAGAVSALSTDAAGAEKPEALNAPHGASAFREDSTLRFMGKTRKAHGKLKVAKDVEVERSRLCLQHGFKAAERAGCVAFMRQACRRKGDKASKSIEPSSCQFFFMKQEQPGYSSKLAKKQDSKNGGAQNPIGDLKDWQEGPNYDSKKARKATDKVMDKEPQGPRDGVPLQDAADAVGDAVGDAADAVGDAFQEAQQGPNYDKKPADKKKKVAPTQKLEKPEEKEDPAVPGCRNSPKGWKDSKGNDCEDYAEGEWCNRHGGYGDAWLDEWGTFEDVATNGKSAKEVCCVCGGGLREQEDFPAGPAPAGAPGGAPAAVAAAPPGLEGPILGSKAGRGLQEQGYSGDLVEHEDQKTMTDDWGREFGPHAGHRDIKTICLENPGNEWCEMHGYYDKPVQSCAPMKSTFTVLVALLFACWQ